MSFPDISIPWADAGAIDSDHDFIGIKRRHRQSMAGDHARSAKAVDSRGEHRAGHMHRVMPGNESIAGTIEHDGDLTVGFPPP
jgi:hypothetical protein